MEDISVSVPLGSDLDVERSFSCNHNPSTDLDMDLDKLDNTMHIDEDIMMEEEHDGAYSTDDLDHNDDCMSDSTGFHDDQDWGFFVLPPEIRELVYRELLLSDSAFRLGHHGPYSHEKRSPTYPAILRTCRLVFEEASNVLYGDNTFYLGPIGHKPTYSASFLTSIGVHNALKIRRLAAHSTSPSKQLRESSLRSWIKSFGLDVDRIKVLAISINDISDETTRPRLRRYRLQRQMNPPNPSNYFQPLLSNQLPYHHQHQQISLATATYHHGQQGYGSLSTVVLPPAGGMPNTGLAIGLPTVAMLLSSNVQTTPQTASSTPNTQHTQHWNGFGAPLQRFNNRNPSVTTPPTLMSVNSMSSTNSSGTTSPTSLSVDSVEDFRLSLIVARLGGWLEAASQREVKQWIVLKNTDLRAGDTWFMYVSNAAKRVRALD